MANCTLSNSTMIITNLMTSVLAISSLVLCVVAIAILIYYKLYHSFNYRLILYLLISFLIDAIGDDLQLPLVWYNSDIEEHSDLCLATMIPANFLELYSLWNIQLCIAFMTAEVFFKIIFCVELRKAEIPLTLACFVLPILPPSLQLFYERGYLSFCILASDYNDTEALTDLHILQYDAIPGMVTMGICVVAIATAMSCLAYRGLQWHFISRNSEEQCLLYEQARKRYQNALKESLPLAVYPSAFQLLLIMYYIYVIDCSIEILLYISVFIDGSIGSAASAIFFIHVKALGQQRRNTFRNRSHITVPSNTVEPINEGQRFTAAGSITGTHVTDFDPLGESDVEPNTYPV